MRKRKLRKSNLEVSTLGKILLLSVALVANVPIVRSAQAQTGNIQRTATEWSSYGGDKASSKYSPLDQIGAGDFNRLKVAWTWRSAEEAITKANPDLRTWVWESTPLVVDGIMYVSTSLSQVAAIDAATGKTKWIYDSETWKNGTPSNSDVSPQLLPVYQRVNEYIQSWNLHDG